MSEPPLSLSQPLYPKAPYRMTAGQPFWTVALALEGEPPDYPVDLGSWGLSTLGVVRAFASLGGPRSERVQSPPARRRSWWRR